MGHPCLPLWAAPPPHSLLRAKSPYRRLSLGSPAALGFGGEGVASRGVLPSQSNTDNLSPQGAGLTGNTASRAKQPRPSQVSPGASHCAVSPQGPRLFRCFSGLWEGPGVCVSPGRKPQKTPPPQHREQRAAECFPRAPGHGLSPGRTTTPWEPPSETENGKEGMKKQWGWAAQP